MSRAVNRDRLVKAAPVFAALGDPTRLRLVHRLCVYGPLSIARLTADTHVSRQAVTKHLQNLADAGLVRSERAGRERIWRIETRRLLTASRQLAQISEQWDAALERLRTFVEHDA